MKKILFAFTVFLLSVASHAGERSVLSVLMKDGTNICFYLNERPLITFVDEDVMIVSDTEEATIPRVSVERFEFLDAMPTSIEDVEMTDDKTAVSHVELSDNGVSINGLKTDSQVRLYTLSGKQLASATANIDGCAYLSLQSLPTGIYLITYNQTPFKFLKR